MIPIYGNDNTASVVLSFVEVTNLFKSRLLDGTFLFWANYMLDTHFRVLS